MAWVAVDQDGLEAIFENKPLKVEYVWCCDGGEFVELPAGFVKKIIGRDLTWDDEPVELK